MGKRAMTYRQLNYMKKKYPEKYKRIIFNKLLLYKIRKIHGKLHCVYCGKYIKIFSFGQTVDVKIEATIDHFLPRSQYPELEFNETNLKPCCSSCNTKKADKVWEEKYPYPQISK